LSFIGSFFLATFCGMPFSRRTAFFIASLLAFIVSFTPSSTQAGLAITGSLGGQSRLDFSEPGFGYTVGLYSKIDEQVWLGVQSGQGVAGEASAIPILASAYVRLPLGRVIMPVATGGLGYALGDEQKGFIWRAGGLFDIRNGRRSSLLLGTEYEGLKKRGGLVGRAGLLLEF
jgi:hypothetical protein